MKSIRMQFLRTSAVLMALGLHAAGAWAAQNIRNVESEEFNELIEKREGVLLDVRTPDETAKEKIANAVELDFYRKDFVQNLELLDRKTPVYVYCRSGSRSSNTSALLQELGFDEVVNLSGGIESWKRSGYPVTRSTVNPLEQAENAKRIGKEWKGALANGKPVLLDFYSKWCVPCRQMSPIVDGLAEELDESANVLKVDIDAHKTFAQEFGVKSVPTFIVYADGKEVWRGVGAMEREQLLAKLSLN